MNVTTLIEKIIAGQAVYPKEIPPLAADLLRKILNPNPKTRCKLEEIIEHPWIKK